MRHLQETTDIRKHPIMNTITRNNIANAAIDPPIMPGILCSGVKRDITKIGIDASRSIQKIAPSR